MLFFEGYGIRLMRLRNQDIEEVRFWRNTEKIRLRMEYREEITAAMQQQWFLSVDNMFNYYFLIQLQNRNIGLIHGANTSWDMDTTLSGGIFIWDENYLQTEIPLYASVLLTQISFDLGLRMMKAKILNNNDASLRFNKMLGYQLHESGETYSWYMLTEESFLASTVSIRMFLEKYYPGSLTIRFVKPLTGAESDVVALFTKRLRKESKTEMIFDGE